MKRMVAVWVAILCSGLVYSGAAAAPGVLPADVAALREMVGQSYYLAHNLHGDRARRKIYSTNYQLGDALLPWGTEVRIAGVHRNYLAFQDGKTGLVWNYWFAGKTRKSVRLTEHVGRVFVKDIEPLRVRVAGLSELDRDGIHEGRALIGMSRIGVLVAIGYPPEFANSREIMAARDWHYWLSRFDKVTISFDRRDLVSRIVD